MSNSELNKILQETQNKILVDFLNEKMLSIGLKKELQAIVNMIIELEKLKINEPDKLIQIESTNYCI